MAGVQPSEALKFLVAKSQPNKRILLKVRMMPGTVAEVLNLPVPASISSTVLVYRLGLAVVALSRKSAFLRSTPPDLGFWKLPDIRPNLIFFCCPPA